MDPQGKSPTDLNFCAGRRRVGVASRRRVPVRDVLGHGEGEQDGLLGDERHVPPQVPRVERLEVYAVHRDEAWGGREGDSEGEGERWVK